MRDMGGLLVWLALFAFAIILGNVLEWLVTGQ